MDIASTFRAIFTTLGTLIYPPRCLMCHDDGVRGQDLCGACDHSLPWLSDSCSQCALPLPEGDNPDRLCGRCLKQPPFFDRSFSLFRYEKEVIVLIHQLKFYERLAVARLLGSLLASKVISQNQKPDCLIPLPIHASRMRQRGFNQSIEISRALHKLWDVPMELDVVMRVRETRPQAGLDASERKRNIKDAFEVVGEIDYEHVAIIDDVVTTGSTVNELSRILKLNGVKQVDVYSIARA